MKKEKILNTIKNLLDLASDQNSIHEAEAASKKAQALIMKYNIDEAEIRQGTAPTIEDVLYPLYKIEKKAEGKWLRSLFSAVAKFNFCKIVISKRYVKGEDDLVEHIYILGEAQNVELVKYLSEQLCHRLRSIRKQAYKEYDGPDNRGTFKRAFLQGASDGIYYQLKSQWDRFSSEEKTGALIRTNDQQLAEFMQERFGELGKARSGSISSNSGYTQGVKAGRSVNISGGLRGSSGAKLLN